MVLVVCRRNSNFRLLDICSVVVVIVVVLVVVVVGFMSKSVQW